ncbi:hypothetical protein [Lacticaseibacillus zhaodongensis]|uniref:hypothetical protein n=1 Tax=Lacticaseibacillus zhaodongensis TaxID=2668065 RepID=UPI0012D2EAFA|nr:hypothetical protein [Lacticaseibacillus zhaodongensis]
MKIEIDTDVYMQTYLLELKKELLMAGLDQGTYKMAAESLDEAIEAFEKHHTEFTKEQWLNQIVGGAIQWDAHNSIEGLKQVIKAQEAEYGKER